MDVVAGHRAWFVAWASRAEDELSGPDQLAWLERLDAEHDNLRTALRRGLGPEGAEACLRLCGALGRFWFRRGHVNEGRTWVEAALAAGPDAPAAVRGKALYVAGHLAGLQSDYGRSRAFLQEAAVLQRAADDAPGLSRTLYRLGEFQASVGEYDRAVATLAESLAVARDAGEWQPACWAGAALGRLAESAGEFDRAGRHYEESLALAREHGSQRDEALMLSHLAQLAVYRGDLESAERHVEASIEIVRGMQDEILLAGLRMTLGNILTERGLHERALALQRTVLESLRAQNLRHGIVHALENVACTLAAMGHARRALRVAGSAARLREELAAALPPAEQAVLERHLAPARQALGAGEARRAEAEGRAAGIDDAVAYALAPEGGPAPE
jgi:tetratricopeptide (TPR) repeat protein